MAPRNISVLIEHYPLIKPFQISRALRTSADVVVVRIEENGFVGRGEGRPTERYEGSCDRARDDVISICHELEEGLERTELQQIMKAGAARNAIDCALWDLEAKQTGRSVWDLTARTNSTLIETAYSLGIDAPKAMAKAARDAPEPLLLKLKLAGDGYDIERMRAVRAAMPETRLVADANESLSVTEAIQVIGAAEKLQFEMIEQPCPTETLCPISQSDTDVILCADEACRTTADLDKLEGQYGMINIKLDKAGGLTEALKLEETARQAGLSMMVGCMFSTSLGIAPAMIVARGAQIIDLDAPLHLSQDREHAIIYDGCRMQPPSPKLWG